MLALFSVTASAERERGAVEYGVARARWLGGAGRLARSDLGDRLQRHGRVMRHDSHVLDAVAKVPYATQVHVDRARPLNVGYVRRPAFSFARALNLGSREINLVGFDTKCRAYSHHGQIHLKVP